MTKVLFPHWKKNEVWRPASFAGYSYVVAIATIYLICALLAPHAAAMNYTPALTDIYVSGVYSGYPTDTKDKMIDYDYGTRWTSSSTSWWFNYTNPSGYNLTTVRVYGLGNRQMKCNDGGYFGSYPASDWGAYNAFTPTTSFVRCQGDGALYGQIYELRYSDDLPEPTAEANFTCSPRTGVGSLTTTCIPAGTGFTQFLWTWGDGGTTNTTSTNVSHLYSLPGIYSPNLNAYSTPLMAWYNTTNMDYITVTSTPIGIKTEFQAVDGATNGLVDPVSIFLKDVETGDWSNTTSGLTSTWNITTAADHHIDAYATAPGYAPVSRLGLEPTEYFMYELIMWLSSEFAPPGSGLPGDPGLGNVNLIVEVNDGTTKDPITGATVTTTDEDGATQSVQTGSAGTARFAVPNVSVIRVDAQKSGYIGAAKITTTSDFGPDTVRIELDKRTVTTEPTLAPGVTATTTVLPGCEDPTSSACMQSQDQAMASDIRGYLNMLIPFAFIFTLLYMAGWKP